jgi:hypothetical protein
MVESYLNSDTNYSSFIVKTLGIICKLNINSFKEIETQILEKLIKVLLKAMALFANLQSIAIEILYNIVEECNGFNLQLISFDRNKCIELVMQSIINFVSNDYNSDKAYLNFEYCSDIVTKIFNNEKSKSYAQRVYLKTLLEIIRKNVGLKSYYCN